MKRMNFDEAIENAIIQAMLEDDRIIIMGEDVHTNRSALVARFSDRIFPTPISEASFLGAGITAAMAGLKPIVELWMIDFICVAFDAIVNHATKVYDFSGKRWGVPLVIRAPCGGGLGDGGQHEQILYGSIASIPGIKILLPSNPADAGGLMLAALQEKHPVIFLEHKLLSEQLLYYLGGSGRNTVKFDVPENGIEGEVPDHWVPLEIGKLKVLKEGTDLTMVSAGVAVHRCMDAAIELEKQNISAEILDLRTIVPLDIDNIAASVQKTGKILIVDEDYKQFGLSGEIAASLLERKLNFTYQRIGTETTIPFSPQLEVKTLPSVEKIVSMSQFLFYGSH
ncbi:MAG: pyruvate dehydrogenase [Candidatus Lokiarchaeota archaeon]|nr:pyruvate dehydrogenase [Candidatus Lokiarchaeota archaeon]